MSPTIKRRLGLVIDAVLVLAAFYAAMTIFHACAEAMVP